MRNPSPRSRSFLWLASLALAGLTACSTTREVTFVTVPMQTPQTFRHRQVTEETIPYLLYLPKDYQRGGGKTWPLLLFLHGAGERGHHLTQVGVHGPPKVVAQRPDFPFILVSPQCPPDRIWSREALHALVEHVSQEHAVDQSRRYVTGLSMGGYGTWDLGLNYPETFAAIAPVCGGGEWISILLASEERKASLQTLGVWAFHGAKDTVVPVSESERMIDACRRAGMRDLKLTVYPDADHDSWTETYANSAVYEWLLEHRRNPAP